MFTRRFEAGPYNKSFSRSQKLARSNSSFTKDARVAKRYEQARRCPGTATGSDTSSRTENFISAIVTLVIGPEQRIFAAHENVLNTSPFLQSVLQNQTMDLQNKKIILEDEEPEIFSAILEYLYRGDYYPRLVHNKKRNAWDFEETDEAGRRAPEATVFHRGADGDLLKDTVIYCAATKYGLDELQHIALRKQGLQSGIQASTILASARYAYANTPDSDSKLRAHYLALIIRSRSTFKRSGTMQLEMYHGGTQLFFDLFVALCNHVDDILSAASPRTSRSGRHLF